MHVIVSFASTHSCEPFSESHTSHTFFFLSLPLIFTWAWLSSWHILQLVLPFRAINGFNDCINVSLICFVFPGSVGYIFEEPSVLTISRLESLGFGILLLLLRLLLFLITSLNRIFLMLASFWTGLLRVDFRMDLINDFLCFIWGYHRLFGSPAGIDRLHCLH